MLVLSDYPFDGNADAPVAARAERAWRGSMGEAIGSVGCHEPPLASSNESHLLVAARVIAASARLTLAFGILDEVKSRGEKALVFLESRAVQDALAEILQRRYRLPHRVLIINGEVSGATRKGRVDEFQNRPGFDVMLLSPRAGGVGLTLTKANHVIHLARWWNPAVEDQCTDRVYRIGQQRPVHVYNVLAVHPQYGERSFDVQLTRLLDRKRALNRSVLAPPVATEADLEELYRSTLGM